MLKLKQQLPQESNLYKVKVMLKAAVAQIKQNYELGLQKCQDIIDYLQSFKLKKG